MKKLKSVSLIMSAVMLCGMFFMIPATAVDYASAGDTGSFDTFNFQNYPNTCTENFEWIVKDADIYCYDQMIQEANALAAKYPDRVQKRVIGYSELGREIFALVLGPDTAESKELFVGNAHAREEKGALLLMKQANFYLENWNNTVNGEKISDLVKRCQMNFIPMNNPDGNMLVAKGFKSLDIIQDSAQRQIRIDFLKPLLKLMNDKVALTNQEHDTDWVRPDDSVGDFRHWKSNINGVDDHYNYWTPKMNISLASVYDANPRYKGGPYYMDYVGEEGASTSENKAIVNYINTINPNILVTFHQALNLYQWNYGYKTAQQEWAKGISGRLSSFIGMPITNSANGNIGFVGYMRETRPNAYSACIEVTQFDYFKDVPAFPGWDNDACPSHVQQFNTDVTTTTGEKRYSVWTKDKFYAVYTAQYLINNALIAPAGESTLPDAPSAVVKQTKPITADVPNYPGEYINAPDPKAPVSCIPTPSKVLVNGTQVKFESYNIGGANYFKLRDLAMALADTPKKFSVAFDSTKNVITLNKGGTYVPIGGELTVSDAVTAKTAIPSPSALYLATKPLLLKAYNIDGANYFKLRDIGANINFAVTWDAVNSIVGIETTAGLPVASIYDQPVSPKDAANTGASIANPCELMTVETRSNTFAPSDVKVDSGKVEIYSTNSFNAKYIINDPVFLPGAKAGAMTNLYVKVTQDDGTKFYGKIVLKRSLEQTDPSSTEITKVCVTSNIVYDNGIGTIITPRTVTRGNFADRKGMDLKADVVGVPGSSITFYTDNTFTTVLTNTKYTLTTLNGGVYVAYAKVVAKDGKTTTYYIVEIKHN